MDTVCVFMCVCVCVISVKDMQDMVQFSLSLSISDISASVVRKKVTKWKNVQHIFCPTKKRLQAQ